MIWIPTHPWQYLSVVSGHQRNLQCRQDGEKAVGVNEAWGQLEQVRELAGASRRVVESYKDIITGNRMGAMQVSRNNRADTRRLLPAIR